MAKATKQTERVEKVIYEDKDVVTVKMSVEEAEFVYNALWLMEMRSMNDPVYVAIKDVQNAIGDAIDYPETTFRFDVRNARNANNSVYIERK